MGSVHNLRRSVSSLRSEVVLRQAQFPEKMIRRLPAYTLDGKSGLNLSPESILIDKLLLLELKN